MHAKLKLAADDIIKDCEKKVCVSDCDRKSECNPGYGSQWAEKYQCPLNVCCSKSGFCGTTKDFCGDKKVKRPSCSKDSGVSRVIGYYEGWVNNRPCNKIYPEQIPVGVYTHINFAFATIDPKTFQVQPVDSADINTYKRLMLVKQKDPDLKVFVAIGGWTFNDPGFATRTTFSDLAASIPRQQTFIRSLTSFMSTYGFDGVDLDWEYPEADDRGGRSVDYANFPKFMNRLKSGLAATGGKNGLSITLPCSYWYLQHFDLKALAKEISWFNIMSYDMHGVWDRPNKFVGPYLNAHTNLTEIQELGLDLLWRNDVRPDMVTMGVAFYGRSFTASSASCLTPGCTYEAGGNRGKCSREIGILMNSEIDDIVKQKSVNPTWYRSAAVKVATWDSNQWVSFDDADTLKQKAETAQGLCLGGLMVWAISHDTQDGKYSRALAKVANRKVQALADTDGDANNPYKKINVPIASCKWSNCGEGCPAGWAVMRRSDPGARRDEYMFDEQGCDGGMSHMFCCPTDSTFPICGWYTHNNGACDNQCPPGKIEIGSNNMYCRKNYQAACCTVDVPSMRVYSTCEWGAWPHCDDLQRCPWADSSKSTGLAYSSSGSGGAFCMTDKAGYFTQRKYCCDTADVQSSFTNCKLYWNYGLAGSDRNEDNFCWSGCPPEYTRVAMDGLTKRCAGKEGAQVYCCIASVSKTKEVENPVLADYRTSLTAYLKNPVCDNPLLISKRQVPYPGVLAVDATLNLTRTLPALGERDTAGQLTTTAASNSDERKAESLLLILLTAAASKPMLDAETLVWDNTIGTKFANLKISNLKSYLESLAEWKIEGPIEMVRRIMCSPHLWDMRAAKGKNGGKTSLIDCSILGCKIMNQLIPARTPDRKRAPQARPAYQATFTDAAGNSYSIFLQLPDHPSAGGLDSNDPMYDEAIDYTGWDDCSDTSVAPFSLPNNRFYELEHPLDGVLIANFITDAAAGRLPSGATSQTGRISASFFRQARDMNLPLPLPPLPGGQNYLRPYDRVMECVGSETNRANFVLAFRDINQYKGRLVRGRNVIDPDKWAALVVDTTTPSAPLLVLRGAIAVIRYMDRRTGPPVNARLANVVTDVYAQWVLIENEWNRLNPNDQIRVADAWREWAPAQMAFTVAHTRRWVGDGITDMRRVWAVRTGDEALAVLEVLTVLERELPTLSIGTSGFP
ncbi:hypothetical protein B0H66DRAFT_521857 [Apodospora peruviana]|uniref:chitinase n=1 Tax=Apodospora peruviana TaxID=516989 RepID=A0AAE0HZ09_9PEZI|nr:hypothetical protein B0H66DRAFT_521857 [Apodospora peruviana]